MTYQGRDDRKEDGRRTDVTRDLCHDDGHRGYEKRDDRSRQSTESRQELANLVRQPWHLVDRK